MSLINQNKFRPKDGLIRKATSQNSFCFEYLFRNWLYFYEFGGKDHRVQIWVLKYRVHQEGKKLKEFFFL